MSYDPMDGTSPYLGMDRTTRYDATQGADDRYDGLDSYGDYDADLEARGYDATTSAPGRDMPTTVRRPYDTQVSGRARRSIHRPAPVAPVPSPPQQSYQYADPYGPIPRKAGPLNLLSAFLLYIVALALRVGGIACAGVVVACAVLTGSHRVALVQVLNIASEILPPSLLGHLVYETPFGGALRGDIIILSLVLLIADWLCMRTASRLRHPEERWA